VDPEKFRGYHNATDFEIFDNEIDTDIFVRAICDGKLLQKRTATGYGGLVVQSCTIDEQAVTVVYGHLRLSSINSQVGAEIKRGDTLGLLGKAYSTETSGERKHLHLGIHKGTAIDIRGYVPNKSELSAWLNFEELVK
jgi:murein DD-endopeptidase MepM/ murein hydrolase activator NlpD